MKADRPQMVVPVAEPEQIAAPRASASVVVVRDGADGLEVFMLERHLRSDFAGGAYVFPGGTLDQADGDEALASVVDMDESLARQMGEASAGEARGLAVCGIRETFEEAGVLLARGADGRPVSLIGDRWSELRTSLAAGQLSALDLARQTGIRYSADLLRFWARWVTPTFAPKRYDTRFFIAHVPHGQTPLHDDVETTASRWIAPAHALEQARAGAFSIIFPTRKMLESLAVHPDAASLYAAAVDRPSEPILPEVVTVDGTPRIKLPGDDALHEP